MSNPPIAFDRVAAEYERTRPIPPAIADSVARHIVAQVPGEGWILDAGCGTGRFTRPLAVHHPRVVGIDAAPGMLAELRRLQAPARLPLLLTGDLRALPLLDGQCAAVLSVHVLHLIADWRQALAEMWRVLAPGGLFLLGYEDRAPSAVRDFYFREGRARDLLPGHPGARNTAREILPVLENEFGAVRRTEVAPDAWKWPQTFSVNQMLRDMDARLYSSQWQLPESAHAEVMAATRENAIATFGPLESDPHETRNVRFVLHSMMKP